LCLAAGGFLLYSAGQTPNGEIVMKETIGHGMAGGEGSNPRAELADKFSRYRFATCMFGCIVLVASPFLYYDPSLKNDLGGPVAGCILVPLLMWLDYFISRRKLAQKTK
jgi:hypothetical protein